MFFPVQIERSGPPDGGTVRPGLICNLNPCIRVPAAKAVPGPPAAPPAPSQVQVRKAICAVITPFPRGHIGVFASPDCYLKAFDKIPADFVLESNSDSSSSGFRVTDSMPWPGPAGLTSVKKRLLFECVRKE
jgi:hypothetical protein